MKSERDKNYSNQSNTKGSTRPQTALELNINAYPVNNANKSNIRKYNRSSKEEPIYRMMIRSEEKERQKYLKGIKNNRAFQNPGPGYYFDYQKRSTFYKDSIPLPEYKQSFFSNNERFPEIKENEFLGPGTYFTNNNYFNSTFANSKISKNNDLNYLKGAPFSSRQQRLKKYNNAIKNPGPGSYNPKLYKNIDENKFKNDTNSFNLRTKRFASYAEEKWKEEIPGPGSYINPYSAVGTSNTILVNGIYYELRKGKNMLQQKPKKSKSRIKNSNKVPDVGFYNPGKLSSIEYKNDKKVKGYNLNINVAFNTRFKSPLEERKMKSKIGPGSYFKNKYVKSMQIKVPFWSKEVKLKDPNKMFAIGPGQYDTSSYFDWNKKSFNATFY